MPPHPNRKHGDNIGHLVWEETGFIESVHDDKSFVAVSAARVESFLERVDHLTWAWFTLPMATGGLALLLGNQPHTFSGLLAIGKIFYIWDLLLFSTLSVGITTRFIRGWGTGRLSKSFHNPTEGLFFPCFLISLSSIIPGMWIYGGEACGVWLAVVVRILFWMYLAVAFLAAVGQYTLLFSGEQLTIQSMTPAWLLPFFPAMLTGIVAVTAVAANAQWPEQAFPIAVAGVAFQALGFWMALFMFGVYVLRLMQSGFPAPNLRPGMFISVGPPNFTIVALIGLAQNVPRDYGYLSMHPAAHDQLQTMALVFGIFIWTLGFFFWSVSFVACVLGAKHMSFHMVWYAWVFPNVGFVLAIIKIGSQLESNAVEWVGSVLTIVLVGVYLFVLACQTRAFMRREILWPGKDEDKDA